MFYVWSRKSFNSQTFLKEIRPCLAFEFFVKFICYKFFINISYCNLKKLFENFKLYTSKYSNIYTLHKFFLKTSTITYSKTLNKHPKNSLAKRGPKFWVSAEWIKRSEVLCVVIQFNSEVKKSRSTKLKT